MITTAMILAVIGAMLTVVVRVLASVVPHLLLRVALSAWRRSHPRRREIEAEYPDVATADVAHYVSGIVVVALVDGVWSRFDGVRLAWAVWRFAPSETAATGRSTLLVRYLFNASLGLGQVYVSRFVPQEVAPLLWLVALTMFLPNLRAVCLHVWVTIKGMVASIGRGNRHLVAALMDDYKRHTGEGR